MNWFGFIQLMREIYGPGLPDLTKIQQRGLLAVKIGQTFALRVDFLDEAKCRHLTKLYRQTAAIPAEDFNQLIDQSCPPDWRSNFRQIDPQPLATASVGQVHRATLHDGREVVIKLIKGNFKQRFIRDVRSVKKLMKFVVGFYPKLRRVADPVGILEHIEEYTLAELDLRNEIAHGKVLRQLRANHPHWPMLAHLRFPEVHESLSNENVLVTEFIAGQTLDELLENGQMQYADLLKLFLIHGACMFGVGTFHGDIHPGNIFLKNGDLYFIDTGALSHASEKIRRGLFQFFEGLAAHDYQAAARALEGMAELGLIGARREVFERDFLALYRDFQGKTVSQLSLTRQMMQTIKLAVHAGMEFERGMYPIIKSLMYLDGMVLKCRPDAVLIDDMRPHLAEFRRVMALK